MKKDQIFRLVLNNFHFIRVFGFICICRVLEKNKYGTEMCDIGAFNGMEWIRILFLINGVFRMWVVILILLAMILLSLFFLFLCQWD